MALAFVPLAIFLSAHAYPTFELSNAVQLLAKIVPRERKLGSCSSVTLYKCCYHLLLSGIANIMVFRQGALALYPSRKGLT